MHKCYIAHGGFFEREVLDDFKQNLGGNSGVDEIYFSGRHVEGYVRSVRRFQEAGFEVGRKEVSW